MDYQLLNGCESNEKPSAESKYGARGIDININIREESRSREDGSVYTIWVYDTFRYLDKTDYLDAVLRGVLSLL